MGMESDQEVVQMVGRDPRYSVLLLPSIEVSNMIKNLKSVMILFYFFVFVFVVNFRYSPRNLNEDYQKYDHV
jgi:hypothetical protein